MDIRKLQRAIVDGLEDVKAQNIVVFNTEHLTPLFERVIIASGTSNRQTKALAASVRESVKSRGMQVMRTEGEDNGEWIIVDCGAAVAHIMQPAIRDYYHLEEIWGDKAVRMKLAPESAPRVAARSGPAAGGDGGRELEALAGPGHEAARATPETAARGRGVARGAARGGAAQQPAGRRATERITGTRSASPGTPGRKQAAKQGTAKRSGAKPAAPGKAGSARAVAAQAGARKAAPAKAAPRKRATGSAATAAKKAPPRRASAKKAPASKAPGRSSRSGRR